MVDLYWKDVNRHHEYNGSNNNSELDDVSCFKHKYGHVTSRIHGQCTKWFVLEKVVALEYINLQVPQHQPAYISCTISAQLFKSIIFNSSHAHM